MHMAVKEYLGRKVFYYETFKDDKGRERRKTVCIQELKSPEGEIFYAKGSTVCSMQDKYVKKIGKNIAEQRADKMAGLAINSDFEYPFLRDEPYAHRMWFLTRTELLSDFEKKLLGLDDKKKEALPNDGGMPGGVE